MAGTFFSAAVMATLAFGLIKWGFRFVVWYTRDEDPLFRKKLDKLWDALQERTAVQVTRSSLQHVANSMQFFTGSSKGMSVAVLLFLVTNFVAIAVAAAVWRCNIIYFTHGETCSSFFAYWYSWRYPAAEEFSACFAAMIGHLLLISFASLLLSQWLIRLAASAVHLILLVGLLMGAIAVIVIAGFASWWLYVALNQFTMWQGESVPCVGELSYFLSDTTRQKLELMSKRVDRYVNSYPGFGIYWVGAWLGAISAFPLVVALLASCTLLLIRSMPRLLNDFLVKCLYLISTDKEPVLSYVGTIAGGIAAIASFVVSL
ncbi:hypothetical protein XH81_04270 [Bradyrhizobium sp. CCBAU 25360]|uniref:hypothetical protein n=1 Tax=Bradyrhizobium sp. CCBAU 25360 TaxID=858425 RepID=UPI0023062FD5|nr:hypothetical protein [Bradyrhizobium sp. CCBAU 25360]MDA9414080.1 hypothetical protein [Bradyrhizobium sp. CCBAU 25360]